MSNKQIPCCDLHCREEEKGGIVQKVVELFKEAAWNDALVTFCVVIKSFLVSIRSAR